MKLFETLKNIWNIDELRERIIMTFSLLLVFRFGAQVTIPGIDSTALAAFSQNFQGGGIGSILNAFTGGAFAKASVFALGIMPYISASIVVQLMGIAVPYLQKLQKEGESGRRKINQITRWLTIGICLIQAPSYLLSLGSLGVPQEAYIWDNQTMFLLVNTFILLTGTVFAMWLGEKITDKGIGNGISLLIMVGIIATLPQAFFQELVARIEGAGSYFVILLEVILWLVVILACIMLVMAVRQIPVQYARRTATGDYEKNVSGNRQFLPLKLNASGVMPIIFAQAIMFVPQAFGQLESGWAQSIATAFADIFGFWYNLTFALLIIVFTYFYTAITVPTNKMAEDLKRNNGFIPGVRPGTETADYLDKIMSQITLPGSIFLAFVAIIPAFVSLMGVTQSWALFFGGTSLLIMVGVAIDTMQQINSYLLNRHYDGLIKTGKNRKAVA